MARLDGKQPNVGAIILGAVIFALVAGGLFFAFRPVPEPTDAGLSNSAQVEPAPADSDANAAGDESENSLATILTPLPTATPLPTPLTAEPVATPDETTAAPGNVLTLPDGNAAANTAPTNSVEGTPTR